MNVKEIEKPYPSGQDWTLDEYLDVIGRLQDAEYAIRVRIIERKAELICAHCPVKVGEIVTIEGKYVSHRGKQMEVTRIQVRDGHGKRPEWFVISGLLLRKDGSVGTTRGAYDIPIKEKTA